MTKKKSYKYKEVKEDISINAPEFDVSPELDSKDNTDITHEFILDGLRKIYSDLENEEYLKDMLIEIATNSLEETKADAKKILTNCGSLWIKNRQEKADVLSKMTNHLAKWGEEINRERILLKKMNNNELYREYRKIKSEVDNIIEKYRKNEWINE